MNTIIGTLTLTGTDAQNARIAAMAQTIMDVLGPRLGKWTIAFQPRSAMPQYGTSGKHAFGFTKSRIRTIWLADPLKSQYPIAKVLAHELAGHGLDHDWFTDAQRLDLCVFLDPKPKTWHDNKINGQLDSYQAAPAECNAVWLPLALGILPANVEPAFFDYYDRVYPQGLWSAVATVALKDYGAAEPPVDEPLPTPAPDNQVLMLEAALTALQSKVDAAKAALA